MTEAITAEIPLPKNVTELAAFMKTDDDIAVNAMYDRLVAKLGQEPADEMWTHALNDMDHDAAIDEALDNLKKELGNIVLAWGRAEYQVRRLTGGDAWHVDFAEGSIGRDLADFLGDVGRAARAAEALYGKAVGD